MATSTQSYLGRGRNIVRRLRKDGQTAAASAVSTRLAQMELEGRGGRLSREARDAQSMLDSITQLARLRSSQPGHSYEEDILPLKHAIDGVAFGVSDPIEREEIRGPAMAAFNTASDEAFKSQQAVQGLRARDLSMEQAEMGLTAAADKLEKIRDAEARSQEMGNILGDIVNSPGSSTDRAKKMFSHVVKNPQFYSTDIGEAMHKSALSAAGIEMSPLKQDLLSYATRVNSPTAIKALLAESDLPENIKQSMVEAATEENRRKEAIARSYNKSGGKWVENNFKVATDAYNKALMSSAKSSTIVNASNLVIQVAQKFGFTDPIILELKKALEAPVEEDKRGSSRISAVLLEKLQAAYSALSFFVNDLEAARMGQASPVRSRRDPSVRPTTKMSGLGVPARNI